MANAAESSPSTWRGNLASLFERPGDSRHGLRPKPGFHHLRSYLTRCAHVLRRSFRRHVSRAFSSDLSYVPAASYSPKIEGVVTSPTRNVELFIGPSPQTPNLASRTREPLDDVEIREGPGVGKLPITLICTPRTPGPESSRTAARIAKPAGFRQLDVNKIPSRSAHGALHMGHTCNVQGEVVYHRRAPMRGFRLDWRTSGLRIGTRATALGPTRR